ncbi:MAG: HDOD domain-containing protein [Nitrospirae bacterium]|nr:HDOD domain-containing protein [Nitrospirota bacterium]
MERLQEDSDFPAMAQTINIINQFKVSEDTTITEFANIVLKDYALTTRVLRLVNSVNYAQFGEVTTISRAIILLGIDNIKNLALTLILFDHLEKNSLNVEHRDTMLKSLYSGILAQKISSGINFAEREEAYICSLFHNFGKMLVSFALPGKIEEIKFICHKQGISEDAAALSVLGARYDELGMEMAREWHFPKKVIDSMRKLRGMESTPNPGGLEKLDSISCFANGITEILSTGAEKKEMDRRIGNLVIAFKSDLGLPYDEIKDIINTGVDDLKEFSGIYNINLDELPFNRQLVTWADMPDRTVAAALDTELLKTIDTIFESEKEDAAEGIFAKGIQDINSAILSNFSLNDIIRIVLETMYRGMQLSERARALFLIKDTRFPSMSIKFGFGEGIQEIKKWFTVPLGKWNDIFNIAIMKQNDLVIEDIEPDAIRKLLPEWFKNRVFKKTFIVLLPILIHNKPIGMFYIEGDREGFKNISSSHLNYLRILRDQTVMAIKHKQW